MTGCVVGTVGLHLHVLCQLTRARFSLQLQSGGVSEDVQPLQSTGNKYDAQQCPERKIKHTTSQASQV